MRDNRFTSYLGVPRPRKVKHVKFFEKMNLSTLEEDINNFADDHPEYKILGMKLTLGDHGNYISTVTYLEDSKGVEYEDYPDEPYED